MYLPKTESKRKYTPSPGRPIEARRWLLGVFKKWAQFHGPPQLTHKQAQECQPHRHTGGEQEKLQNHQKSLSGNQDRLNQVWHQFLEVLIFFFPFFLFLIQPAGGAQGKLSHLPEVWSIFFRGNYIFSEAFFLSDREICCRSSCFRFLKVATNDFHSLGLWIVWKKKIDYIFGTLSPFCCRSKIICPAVDLGLRTKRLKFFPHSGANKNTTSTTPEWQGHSRGSGHRHTWHTWLLKATCANMHLSLWVVRLSLLSFFLF